MDKDIHNFLLVCVFRFKSVRTLLRPYQRQHSKNHSRYKNGTLDKVLVPWGDALSLNWKGNLALRE
ncbi:hypothetical protein LT85_3531 [Collimonas arenae]|uniref:Uncharacterized protein n=1 Tax=Collimonas arenae TaxID=279058 RepID=A0A0A1FGA6_9BURK|nr:hypothetical protein LT85_3531 [Collimonas arenae]